MDLLISYLAILIKRLFRLDTFCPKCRKRKFFKGKEKHTKRHIIQTYKCANCGHTKEVVIATKSEKSW